MVGGDDRDTSGREVLREEALEEALPLVVERGERFVERPERRALHGEAGEPDATALAGGKPARGEVAALLQAHSGERRAVRFGATYIAPTKILTK